MISPPKTLAQARKYRYNTWGGNPLGNQYREGYCAENVHDGGRGGMFHQCTRKATTGPSKLFCGQHNPAAVAAREKARADRYAKMTAMHARADNIRALAMSAELLRRAGRSDAASACRELAKKLREKK